MDIFSIRLLQGRSLATTTTVTPNVDFMLTMPETTITSILPAGVLGGGGLSLKYNINEPEFVASLLEHQQSYYHFFGWFIVIFLTIFYFLKGVVIASEYKDKGELIAHVLLTKTVVLITYPAYS